MYIMSVGEHENKRFSILVFLLSIKCAVWMLKDDASGTEGESTLTSPKRIINTVTYLCV
jgi:hypothetical protein